MEQNYIAVDLETTGLNPKKDKIIEIGAVKVKQGREAGQFSCLINPGRRLERLTTELTGITDEMLLDALPLEAVLEDFLEFGEKLPLAGHQVIFDYSFIKKASVQAGICYQRDGIDTLKLVRMFYPELERKTLSFACEAVGILPFQSHRAMADAKACSQLLEHLWERFGAESPNAFVPRPLIYQVKKEKMMTKHQKDYLNDLIKCNRIKLNSEIDRLTRSEASRLTDQLISQYGKLKPEQREPSRL